MQLWRVSHNSVAVLRNDKRNATTFSTFAASEAREIEGRFAAREKSSVVGTTQAVEYPAGPNWAADPVGIEPPLGVDVHAIEPTGESFEIAASLGGGASIEANPAGLASVSNVRHGRYGKAEPKPRAMSPAAVNQLGAHVGDHVTERRGSSGYRGVELVRGKGYSTPVGPTDNVAAVGVGGGRTVMRSGQQAQHGQPSAGSPTPKAKGLFPGWEG
jgi:hypothetical protein